VNSIGRGGTERALAGIDVLERNDIPFTAGIVAFQANKHNLCSTIRALIARYRKSLRAIDLNRLMPSKALGPDYFKLKLPPDEYIRVTSAARDVVKELRRNDINVFVEKEEYRGCVLSDDVGSNSCLQGITRAEAFVNGDVGPCPMLRDSALGNLYQESWPAIWKRSRWESYSTIREGKGMLCQLYNAS
jgi:sulfatase maturation enzyme AslB (radical SAM superfamily)